jgi:hypothetical protein
MHLGVAVLYHWTISVLEPFADFRVVICLTQQCQSAQVEINSAHLRLVAVRASHRVKIMQVRSIPIGFRP